MGKSIAGGVTLDPSWPLTQWSLAISAWECRQGGQQEAGKLWSLHPVTTLLVGTLGPRWPVGSAPASCPQGFCHLHAGLRLIQQGVP